ncbi:hypothetical protein BGX26_013011 [Mortierella sp. AD094]|nr:hypothetical protein BGX26_013011 [Mortierella sp. AD094]
MSNKTDSITSSFSGSQSNNYHHWKVRRDSFKVKPKLRSYIFKNCETTLRYISILKILLLAAWSHGNGTRTGAQYAGKTFTNNGPKGFQKL